MPTDPATLDDYHDAVRAYKIDAEAFDTGERTEEDANSLAEDAEALREMTSDLGLTEEAEFYRLAALAHRDDAEQAYSAAVGPVSSAVHRRC